MRVLVTGGAGFIGSHVSRALLARGDDVVVVDDFSSGKRANLAEGVELVTGDLTEPGVVEGAVRGCDAVVHCAASASVAFSVDDPLASNRANLEATTRLILAARDAGVGRVVYSSTAAAYPPVLDGPALESQREQPTSPYGMNKLAAEQLLRMAPALYGVDTVCLRYFNVYGPRQDPGSPYSGVISIFVSAALEGRVPTIFGDGLNTRDFIYAGDVARANLAGLDVERGGGVVANVATGRSTTLLDLWDAVRTACGRPRLPVDHGPARAGDIRHSVASVEIAATALGFRAEVSLDAGLEATVAWYRAQLSPGV